MNRSATPGSWKKGQSGNPGGRSSGPAAERLAKLIRKETDDGQLLVDYAKACVLGKPSVIGPDGDEIPIPHDSTSRAYCHAWLTERGWGKPKQELVIAEKLEEWEKPDVRSMPLDRLRRIAAGEPDGGDGIH